MKTYTCKLYNAVGSYHLYEGTILISDSDLATLKGANGEAYFVFDFDSITPSDTGSFVIRNSNGEAVFSKNGLGTGFVKEGVNYDGAWTGDGSSGVIFDTFVRLKGKTLDEAQLSFLMGKIKEAGQGGGGGITTLTSADFDYPTSGAKTGVDINNLDSGLYTTSEDTMIIHLQGASDFYVNKGDYLLVAGDGVTSIKNYYVYGVSAGIRIYDDGSSTVGKSWRTLVGAYNVLNSTSTEHPLSAAQGKVLNEKIEGRILNGGTTAPTTSTVGAVGSLYSYVDTTGTTPEPHLMVCTEVNSGTYTWTDLLGSVTQILHQINNGSN